jgi:hypothetical protein
MGIFIRYFLFPGALPHPSHHHVADEYRTCLFNLLPIPPLDGSHVLESLLPYNALVKGRSSDMRPLFSWASFADQFLHLRIFSRLLGYPIFYLAHFFAGDNFFRLMRSSKEASGQEHRV